MSRQAHAESVQAAIQSVRDFGDITVSITEKRSELFGMAQLGKEKQAEILSLIAMAAGDDPNSDSGRSALEYAQILGTKVEEFQQLIATIDERIGEMARIGDNTVTLLENYLAGF